MVDELRAFDPDLDVVVVDDCSHDATAGRARASTAHTSSRCRSTSASAAPSRPGSATPRENGYELAVRVDGDGQHDPAELARARRGGRLDGEADICVGSRFAGADGYRSSAARRVGIRILARTVSLLTGQRVTDTTSGFQVLNRKAIELFAADYPHDYPEVEAAVMVHKHRLRLVEVPVTMRERVAGDARRSVACARSTTWRR